MSDEKLTVKVRRSKWSRGTDSKLLHPDDRSMCCLGFASVQLGATEDIIRGAATPACRVDRCEALAVMAKRGPSPLSRDWDNSLWAGEAMVINDTQDVKDDERERQLKEHFSKPESPFAGIEFED